MQILTSWKEIAQYLGRSVRTVQRWEERSGLPVRRVDNTGDSSVFAIASEVDEWLLRRRARNDSSAVKQEAAVEKKSIQPVDFSELKGSIDALRANSRRIRELGSEVRQKLHKLTRTNMNGANGSEQGAN